MHALTSPLARPLAPPRGRHPGSGRRPRPARPEPGPPLTEPDYQLNDTLTEMAGLARNPAATGRYAGSF